MKNLRVLFILLMAPLSLFAKDYNASYFGILSDGVTNNTGSIQKAIDFISEKGGGRLVFYVGRYMTGNVQLKSNVSIKLEEGAILVGAPTIYDYSKSGKIRAIISAEGQQNIGISGKGVVEGSGTALISNFRTLLAKGYIKSDAEKPVLIAFTNCSQIKIDSINLWSGAAAALVFDQCNNVEVDLVNIDGKNLPGSSGAVFNNSQNIILKNSFIEVKAQPVSRNGNNKNVQVVKTINAAGRNLE